MCLIRNDGRSPIFVGNADPAAGAFDGLRVAGFLLDRVVFYILFPAVADLTDEAFVQDRIIGGLRLAVT